MGSLFRVSVNWLFLFAPVSIFSVKGLASTRCRETRPLGSDNLGIQQPKYTLVACKHALTKIDKLAQKTTQFPDLYSYHYHKSNWGWRGFDFCQGY
jgi:hypothetical protein